MVVLFKPRDVVRTPSGRLAKVLEILPHHERMVEYLEGEPGKARFHVKDLRMWQAGKIRPWPEHVDSALATSTRVKPLEERLK